MGRLVGVRFYGEEGIVENRASHRYAPADEGKLDWDKVRERLLGSYALIAPKR